MYLPFEQLPENSRVWVYQADRRVLEKEEKLIRQKMALFCEEWNTHGKGMPTSFELFEGQILVLAADESGLGASGCSIDSSVRVLREIESLTGLNFTDQGKISIKTSSGSVRVLSALGMKSKVQAGELTLDKQVINPLIRTKADLEQLWQPIGSSWLNKYFPN